MLTFSRFPRKLSKQRLSLLGALKSNTIGLFSKKDFLIIARASVKVQEDFSERGILISKP